MGIIVIGEVVRVINPATVGKVIGINVYERKLWDIAVPDHSFYYDEQRKIFIIQDEYRVETSDYGEIDVDSLLIERMSVADVTLYVLNHKP